jgi:hypothetical protein
MLLRGGAVLCGLAVGASCASSGAVLSAPGVRYGSVTPEQAVHAFLDAAGSKDYQRMGQQFGTRKGPAELTLGVKDVEQRMVVLAAFLENSGYQVKATQQSLLGPYEHRLLVDMTGTSRGAVTLPFVTVTTEDGRWFVEKIDLGPLTRQSGF